MAPKGGNRAAAGRAESCKSFEAIMEWLQPLITSSEAFSYTTNREVKATNKTVLLTPKYQALFTAGRIASATWCFCISVLTSVLASIAEVAYISFYLIPKASTKQNKKNFKVSFTGL
jgi:hypothetical protein